MQIVTKRITADMYERAMRNRGELTDKDTMKYLTADAYRKGIVSRKVYMATDGKCFVNFKIGRE